MPERTQDELTLCSVSGNLTSCATTDTNPRPREPSADSTSSLGRASNLSVGQGQPNFSFSTVVASTPMPNASIGSSAQPQNGFQQPFLGHVQGQNLSQMNPYQQFPTQQGFQAQPYQVPFGQQVVGYQQFQGFGYQPFGSTVGPYQYPTQPFYPVQQPQPLQNQMPQLQQEQSTQTVAISSPTQNHDAVIQVRRHGHRVEPYWHVDIVSPDHRIIIPLSQFFPGVAAFGAPYFGRSSQSSSPPELQTASSLSGRSSSSSSDAGSGYSGVS